MLGDMKDDAPPDVWDYMHRCEEGSLYQTLMSESGWSGTKHDWKRDIWFRFLFGSSKPMARYETDPDLVLMQPLMEVFASRFPNVLSWMDGQKATNYKRLPRRMQRMESAMMIVRVCGALSRQPGTPLVTIHDSILTTPDHILGVERMILGEFKRLGVCPKLVRSVASCCLNDTARIPLH